MKLAIGSDHRGFEHKQYIQQHNKAITFTDVGTYNAERSDYPLYAHPVCHMILNGHVDGGILLCGTGVGMAIVANRYKGIYAALVWNVEVASRCKAEDNANILVIPSDYVSCQESIAMITAWHEAVFKGGRYAERIAMIDNTQQK